MKTTKLVLVILFCGAIASCGGGGGSTPISTGVPLVWDQIQATWDQVNWQ